MQGFIYRTKRGKRIPVNLRIAKRLVQHHGLMLQFMAEGLSPKSASAKAKAVVLKGEGL